MHLKDEEKLATKFQKGLCVEIITLIWQNEYYAITLSDEIC
jgi:hypothetical protein